MFYVINRLRTNGWDYQDRFIVSGSFETHEEALGAGMVIESRRTKVSGYSVIRIVEAIEPVRKIAPNALGENNRDEVVRMFGVDKFLGDKEK